MLTLIMLLTLAAPYTWEPSAEHKDWLTLWEATPTGKTCRGVVDPATGTYYPWSGVNGRRFVYDANARVPEGAPPISLGCDYRPRGGFRATISGRPASLEGCYAAIGGPREVPDRSQMPWLAACGGSPEQRKALLSQIPADVQALYRVKEYDAEHWAMRPGFAAEPNAARLYVLAPGGEVVSNSREVTPDLIAQLREPQPGRDPKADPDLSRPSVIPGLPGTVAGVPRGALLAAAAVGVASALIPGKKKE